LGAREYGEEPLAEAVERSLERDCGVHTSGGVRSYADGSNLTNALLAAAAFTRTGDFARSFNRGPDASVLAGPVLADAKYPDVLVARAYSNGEDLQLVLYPGRGDSIATAVKVARLSPGREYVVTGAVMEHFTADATGAVSLQLNLQGRSHVTITPKA
jgi:hypothetical protein